MPTGGGHFKGALRRTLTAYVLEIGNVITIGRAWFLDAWLDGLELVGIGKVLDRLSQVANGIDVDSLGHCRLSGIIRRDDQIANALLTGACRDG